MSQQPEGIGRIRPTPSDQYVSLLSVPDPEAREKRVSFDDSHLPTVRILLCDDKNDAVGELKLPEDANIYASKYQLYLAPREEPADQIGEGEAVDWESVGGGDG